MKQQQLQQPSKLNLMKQNSASHLHGKQSESENWSQLRLPSGSLNSRSYHSISYYFKRIYIYGGYELHTGIKDDFFYFDYSTESLGIPKKVMVQNPELSPGPLCRHTANQYKDQLIFYGGKRNIMESTNQICIFDFIEERWERRQPKVIDSPNYKVPMLESHTSCVEESSHKLIVFGGFEVKDGHINKTFEFDIDSNTWRTLSILGKLPPARSSHSAVIINSILYIFGGQNLNQRLGDFWQLNLNTNTWTEILHSNSPQARNGHSMCAYKENIILFGGILGVTREVNDLYCYSTEKQEWRCLEYETKYDRQDMAEEDLLNSLQFEESQNMIPISSRQSPKNFKMSAINEMQNYNVLDEMRLQTESMKSNQQLSSKFNFQNKIDEHQLQKSKLNTYEQQMFEQYINRQKALTQQQQQKQKHFDYQSPSQRLLKKQQLRNVFKQQQIYGVNYPSHMNSSKQQIASPFYANSPKSQMSQNLNDYLFGDNSFLTHDKNKFFADEMIEKKNLQKNGEVSLDNSHINLKSFGVNLNSSRVYTNQNITTINDDHESQFQSFAARIKSQSVNSLKKGQPKESINTIFDKIKRLSMNPLISKEERHQQITELRKKILLREFVDQSQQSQRTRTQIDNSNQQHFSKVQSPKFIKTDNQENGNQPNQFDEFPLSRFPILKSPTTDAMRKAIKQTESKPKNDSNSQQQKFIQLNMSLMLEQIKSVRIENCRIKNIKPQPRDGHSAIIIDENLIILGGDRHKLSFNDMFECNLRKILCNPTLLLTSPRREKEYSSNHQLNLNKQQFQFNTNQIHS